MNARLERLLEPARARLDALNTRASAWFAAREPSEQRLLRIAAVVVPVLLVAGLFSSLQGTVGRLEKRVAAKRADLAYLQSVQGVLASAPPPPAAGETLVTVVDAGSREVGLTLSGTDPVGQNQLRIRLENAPFDTLVGWLLRLQQTQGIGVQNASIDRGPTPGQVNATLTLARP